MGPPAQAKETISGSRSPAGKNPLRTAGAEVSATGGKWYEDRFALGVTAFFFCLNLSVVLNHAMWRDEWAVWLVGAIRPFGEMWAQTAHRGHPIGWYLCAWIFSRLGTDPWGLKVFHVLLSTASIYLISTRGPFNRVQKVLFAFGYFPFFEWGTIMRDYAPEMFTLIAATCFFCARPRRPIAFGIALAFAAQTTAFGDLFGALLGGAYLFDVYLNRKEEFNRRLGIALATGMVIALSSMAFAFAFSRADLVMRPLIMPRPGTPAEWLSDGVRGVWGGDVPIPWNGQWGTNLLLPFPNTEFVLGVLIVIGFSLLIVRHLTALLFFLAGTAALILFSLASHAEVRHQGNMYLLLILSLWIAMRCRPDRTDWIKLPQWIQGWVKQRSPLITVLVGVQCIAAAMLSVQEQVVPFSGSREAAEIILRDAPGAAVVGDKDYAMTPVSGYLGKPIYIPYRREYLTFWQEDRKMRWPPSTGSEISAAVSKVMGETRTDVVLVLDYPMQLQGDHVSLIGRVENSMVPDERYYIYLIRYRQPP
jgi:hypothetical protein